MIEEAYVSFEVAKLLKEKGFDGDGVDAECHMFYSDYTETIMPVTEIALVPYDEVYFAPTQQMAMKWLREVHNLFIQVWILSEQGYWFNIDKLSDNYNHKGLYSTGLEDIYYPTYEEACEAAIKYCLENLI